MKKIRVGAVSYLNTKPLLYGIERHSVRKEIDLVTGYPAIVAQMLVDDEIDVGLVPVAATRRMKEWHIASDYCIGTMGQVASVCLFSEVPMNEIKKVYLDYQSRTSVNLARILLDEYWNQNVIYIDAQGEDFRNEIKGTTAGVVIGDRALEQRLRSTYIYDLGEAWKNHTGLPFVFAAWISNKKLPDEFIKKFNEANAMGFDHLDEVIAENPFDAYDLGVYYRSCVRYRLDEQMINGMNLFLKKLSNSSI
ncbi:MAG: menaquinone biosynthetic enzyme MqnA/MqnD family protein [Flavitalea sp.]